MSSSVDVLALLPGSGWSWAGAVVGLLALAGVALVVAGLPMMRRPGLEERLAPYLRDAVRPSKLLAAPPRTPGFFGLGALAAPYLSRLGMRVDAVLGGSASVVRRQQRAGQQSDLERFRAEQVLAGFGGAIAAILLTGLQAVSKGQLSLVMLVLLVVVGALAGIAGRDLHLSRSAHRREQRMLAEFPTVAELLALAVSAGEGATGALERVCRLSHGELSDELRRCLADARAGANLPTALEGLARRTGLLSLSRFVDGIVVAVERGTPLAEVLRAQAQDVREQGRRALMEEGARKEITMMVPVVFLILPVTVLFALYPGASYLNFSL
ncbi:MAG: type II secretion system F family protein [Intrasporangium sp.]|uniref:type II secretion system F family protein n=1 Tax=Intrasporangium sp. TaxID=1925024 RepID=UPI0026482393|nr:type II secretion system F family protein [Intrasporangium sp.]MDN5795230.1 type II secretion system F family protein [Intrasporangium sp.]